MNSAFHARCLVSSEVISQVLFTSEQPKKNKMAFVRILSQIKLLFGLDSFSACVVDTKAIIHLSVGESGDIHLQFGKYTPLFTSTLVSNC